MCCIWVFNCSNISWNCLCTFVKNQFNTYVGLTLASLFCSLIFVFILMLMPYSLDYCSLKKIWHQVVLVLQLYSFTKLFWHPWSFHFHVIFRLNLLIYTKMCVGSLVGIALTLKPKLTGWDIRIILGVLLMNTDHRIYLCLFRFSLLCLINVL